MTTNLLTVQQTDRTRAVLQKLSEVSPEKRDAALMMCDFFLNGMNAQERLIEQSCTPTGERREGA